MASLQSAFFSLRVNVVVWGVGGTAARLQCSGKGGGKLSKVQLPGPTHVRYKTDGERREGGPAVLNALLSYFASTLPGLASSR